MPTYLVPMTTIRAFMSRGRLQQDRPNRRVTTPFRPYVCSHALHVPTRRVGQGGVRRQTTCAGSTRGLERNTREGRGCGVERGSAAETPAARECVSPLPPCACRQPPLCTSMHPEYSSRPCTVPRLSSNTSTSPLSPDK